MPSFDLCHGKVCRWSGTSYGSGLERSAEIGYSPVTARRAGCTTYSLGFRLNSIALGGIFEFALTVAGVAIDLHAIQQWPGRVDRTVIVRLLQFSNPLFALRGS